MAQFKQWFEQDFAEKIEIRHCESVMFTGDDKGAVVGVYLFNDGVAYSAGGTITGAVKRSDGGLVGLTGTLSGNAASVVIPAAALAYPGPIGVHVILNQGGSVTTVLKAIYSVDDNSGEAVDPGTILPSLNDLITAINTAVTSIPSDYSALLHTLAPDFSASTAYSAGDYVWYNGALYRFTADHAAGAWTGTDATAAVVGNDLSNLKSALSLKASQTDIDKLNGELDEIRTKTYSVNKVDKSKVTVGYLGTNGKLKTGAGLITDFIPVEASAEYASNITAFDGAWASWFFNANKEPISIIPSAVFTTPSNCTYVRLVTYGDGPYNPTTYTTMLVEGDELPTEYVPYGYTVDFTQDYKDVISVIAKGTVADSEDYIKRVCSDEIETQMSDYVSKGGEQEVTPDNLQVLEKHYSINMVDKSKVTVGHFNSMGVLQTDSGLVTDFIPVEASAEYASNITAFGGAWASWFFNANKEPISIIPSAVFTTPSNCTYVRLVTYGDGTYNPNNYTIMLVLGSEVPSQYVPYEIKYYYANPYRYIPKETILTTYNGVWCALGDSITQYFFGEHKNEKVVDYLGLKNAKSYARAGATWATTSENPETTTSRTCSFGQYNSMIAEIANDTISPTIISIALGTNDSTLGDFWANESTHTVNLDTTTLAGSMHYVLRKLLANIDISKCRVFGIIPPQGAYRNPELSDTNRDKNNMIRRIYEFYSVPYLDLEKDGGFLDTQIVDNGMLADGLHPSSAGNDLYARKLIGYIPTV